MPPQADSLPQFDSEEALELYLRANNLPGPQAKQAAHTLYLINNRYSHRPEGERGVIMALIGLMMNLGNVKVEDRSLGATFIVGEKDYLETALPIESVVQPQEAPPSVSELGLHQLCPYLDIHSEHDWSLCFASDGQLLSIRRLISRTGQRGFPLLKTLCQQEGVYIFHAKKDQKSFRVYSEGRLDLVVTLSERTGDWQFRGIGMEGRKALIPYYEGTGVSESLLQHALELALEMIEQRYGGMFLLGDIADLNTTISPHFKIRQTPLHFIDPEEFTNIAKQDGAVHITSDGMLTSCNNIILPKDQNIEIPPRFQGGGRRGTAYRISCELPNLVIVLISQNRAITLLRAGEYSDIIETP